MFHVVVFLGFLPALGVAVVVILRALLGTMPDWRAFEIRTAAVLALVSAAAFGADWGLHRL